MAVRDFANLMVGLSPLTEKEQSGNEVYEFILDQIESVPHLEALLLLWNSRPQL